MFGQQFTHTDVIPNASNGIHQVMIYDAKEKNVKGYNCLEVEIRYENGVRMSPQFFRIFDLQANATQEQKDAFNYKLSAFCKCFGIEEKFDAFSIQNWKGRQGQVEIGLDKNNYLAVTRFVV